MGGGCSLPLPSLPTNNYMAIAITMSDRMTLLYAGQQEIDIVRQSILTFWNGINQEKVKLEVQNSPLTCYEFKLRGYPFTMLGDTQSSIQIRRMTSKILFDLYNIGWKLMISSDLSRYSDLTTWIFQRHSNPPANVPFFTIGFSSTDKIQINDCPANILQLIRDLVRKLWYRQIQKDEMISEGTHVIKLQGTPWGLVNKDESCHARHLVRELIQLLANNQFTLYGNSNLKSSADTLFFQYDPNSVAGSEEFSSLSLNKCDRIRLIHVSDAVIATVEDAIKMNWSNGVQETTDERPFCFEMKLRGNPWWAIGSEAIAARKLITTIFEKMTGIGYYPITGLDISRKTNDKSYLLFKRGAPFQTKFFCLSLNQTDLIRWINAPPNIVEAGKAIIAHWPKGLQEEKKLYDGVSYQVKLKGNPWSSMFMGDGFHGRALLLALLTSYTSLGWRLVCSADTSAKYIHQDNGPDYPVDVHSWWFMYDETLCMYSQPTPDANLYPTIPPPVYGAQPPAYAPPSYDYATKQ